MIYKLESKDTKYTFETLPNGKVKIATEESHTEFSKEYARSVWEELTKKGFKNMTK